MAAALQICCVLVALHVRGADVTCHSSIHFPYGKSAVAIEFESPDNVVLVPVRVNGGKLWFSFDTGSPYTLIDKKAAERIGIRGGEASTIGGAGAGRVPVTIVRNQRVDIGGVALSGVDLRLIDLSGVNVGRPLEGIVGFDLLCRAPVTVDYAKRVMTIRTKYTPPKTADVLPLEVRGGHCFVQGTIKVPGNPPVTDRFLIDSGSSDAANHPMIMKTTGPLRKTQTGNGLGTPVEGGIGPNEWFRIGRFTIPSTTSVCCGGYEEASRAIGGGILSRFVVTFDYVNGRLVLLPRAR